MTATDPAKTRFDDAAVSALGRALAAARVGRGKTLATPVVGPVTDQDAYLVQIAATAALGRPPVAWKVGAASPTSQPNGAPIFDLVAAPHAVGLPSTGVELEIAFRLGRAFPADRTAPSRDDVAAAVVGVHLAIETCGSRLAEGMAAPAALRLADFGTNLGLVIGPSIGTDAAAWAAVDATRLGARVAANGAVIAETTGGHTHPDLIGLLTWLVGHCVTARGGLAAGTFVTTGSWMGIRWVDTPARIDGTFDGLGHMSLDLARG